MFLERQFQPAEHGLAKSVILVDHANLVDSQHIPEIIHLLASFIVIGSPHIHYIVFQRAVKHFSAGEESDDWDLVSFSQRDIFGRRWRADKKSRAKNAFRLKTLETVFGICWLVAVIEGQQLNLAAKDSPFSIHVIEIGRGAHDGLQPQVSGRTVQCGTGANEDLLVSDSRS